MTASTFTRSLFITTLILTMTPVISFGQTTITGPATPIDLGPVNIKELTGAQMFRYARELYRKGDYAGSAKVFQRIIKGACSNRLAQYHLQKIAQKGAEFKYLQEYLKNLPCEKYDFKEEDFLPASFYYEKDTDLLLEQLVVYNKRYRDNKTSLSAQIAEYARIASELEARISQMTNALASDKKISSETILKLESSLGLAQNQARTMSDQVSELKQALAQATIEKNHTTVYKTAYKTAPAAAEPSYEPPASQEAQASMELSTLQEKFASILERLRGIENTVGERNERIQSLQKNLEPTQK